MYPDYMYLRIVYLLLHPLQKRFQTIRGTGATSQDKRLYRQEGLSIPHQVYFGADYLPEDIKITEMRRFKLLRPLRNTTVAMLETRYVSSLNKTGSSRKGNAYLIDKVQGRTDLDISSSFSARNHRVSFGANKNCITMSYARRCNLMS
jgi:hypothetical protein